jgi:hypothetical protein
MESSFLSYFKIPTGPFSVLTPHCPHCLLPHGAPFLPPFPRAPYGNPWGPPLQPLLGPLLGLPGAPFGATSRAPLGHLSETLGPPSGTFRSTFRFKIKSCTSHFDSSKIFSFVSSNDTNSIMSQSYPLSNLDVE